MGEMKMSEENNLYFDIETTGLSPVSSHVTVIGTVFCDDRTPVLRQFVCERPMDEKKILLDFADYARGFRRIAHFNGKTFDIPYLRKKFSFYRIPDPFYDTEQEDLYQTAKRFSSLFDMEGLKQKDFEAVFGFPRTDALSGADCVSAYRQYLRTGDNACMEKILLHNREDLLGMLHIRSHLAGFSGMAEGDFRISGISDTFSSEGLLTAAGNENDLTIELELNRPFRKPFEMEAVPGEKPGAIPFSFSANENTGKFTLSGTVCELKYFFEDYKNYYYLPVEGRAIHKSVGQFVDPAYREQAVRATAFEPATALFYPQCTPVVQPAFKASADDRISYFRPEDVKSAEELRQVIREAFCAAIR